MFSAVRHARKQSILAGRLLLQIDANLASPSQQGLTVLLPHVYLRAVPQPPTSGLDSPGHVSVFSRGKLTLSEQQLEVPPRVFFTQLLSLSLYSEFSLCAAAVF